VLHVGQSPVAATVQSESGSFEMVGANTENLRNNQRCQTKSERNQYQYCLASDHSHSSQVQGSEKIKKIKSQSGNSCVISKSQVKVNNFLCLLREMQNHTSTHPFHLKNRSTWNK